MSTTKKLLITVPFGGVAFMLQNSPTEIQSRFSEWIEFFGAQAPALLKHQWVDLALQGLLVIGIALIWVVPWLRRRFPRASPAPVPMARVPVPTPASSPEPEPKRDVSLYDAICRALLGRWETIGIANDASAPGLGQEQSNKLHDIAVVEVRQHAFEGRLWIWGKQSENDIIRRIPSDYWGENEVDWYSFMKCMANRSPEQLRCGKRRGFDVQPSWQDLQTSAAQVEALWPAIQKSKDIEIDRLRRDIGRMAESLTSYEPYKCQREDMVERYRRVKDSDHTAWNADLLRQLRRDFLNRCGWAMNCEKKYDSAHDDRETRQEIRSSADQLEELLSRL